MQVDSEDQLSDHKTLLICGQSASKDYRTIKCLDWSKYSESKFLGEDAREMQSRSRVDMSMQMRFEAVNESIVASVSALLSEKVVTVDYTKQWYDDGLMQLRQQRNSAQQRAGYTGSADDWAEYRQLRNLYNRELNKARDCDINRQIKDNCSDPKKLWNILKRYTKVNETIPTSVEFDDVVLTDDHEIASAFNEYFVNSISDIHACIPNVQYQIVHMNLPELWVDFQPTYVEQVVTILNKMKSKGGVFNVNVNVMCDYVSQYGNLVVDLFNESLATGSAPDCLKFTIVSPIPKIRNTTKASEMRPINRAAVLDKVLQNIVKLQLSKFVTAHDVLSQFQSAFKEDHSCETALNLVINKWKMK